MSKKVVRPVIKVETHYCDEMTITEAFAKVYTLIFSEKKLETKSSVRTFDTYEQSKYT